MKTLVVRLALVCVSIIVISLMFVGRSNAKIDPETCVGIWLFDEGSGTTAKDSSGNKNDGTLMNGPKWVGGKFGKALEFDGVDDHVSISNLESLNPTTAITLEAWIYPKKFTADGNGIVTKEGQYILGLNWPQGGNAEKLNLWLTIGGWILFTGDAVSANSWSHVTDTYDGSTVKLYINGNLVNSVSQKGKIATSTNNILIAQGNVGIGPQAFNGLLDEVAIFNVALVEADIKNTMKGFMTAVTPAGKLTTTWATIKSQ